MLDQCEVSRCRAGAAISYLGRGVCERHWDQLTAEDAPPDALRKALGIVREPAAAMEEDTMTTESTQKKTDGNPGKAAKPSKGKAASPKAAKEPRPKRERSTKAENAVVFAFRLTPAERDLIHKAAGPAKASRFVLGAALAAANADTKAFTTLVEQTKANQK